MVVRIQIQGREDREIVTQYKNAYNHYKERVIEGDNEWNDLRRYYVMKEAYRIIAEERGLDLDKDG